MGDAQQAHPRRADPLRARGVRGRRPTSRSRSRRSSRSSTRRRSSSTNRFEELQAAAQGTAARGAPRRRADRLRGRGPHRPLRDFAEAADADRRAPRAAARARRLARRRARRHRHASVEPLAGPAHHRHAALPPERRDPPLRRLAEQHASASTSTSAIRGADRAIAVCNALRNFLPELLALSASSPFVEGVNTGLHSARTRDLHAHVPALRRARRATTAGTASRATSASSTTRGSIDEHTQIWWSVRPHLAFPTVEIRICDAQPDLAEARSLAALFYALTARIARAHRRGRAAADLPAPADRGEPLARDPLRALGRADRPRDAATCVRRARTSSG